VNAVAWKMLTGDRAKFFGLVFAVAFSAMLMQHQAAIFTSLMRRTAAQIRQASDASVWVMDPRTQYWDENEPMPSTALERVRGVEGVRWAVPLFKNVAKAKTREGRF
jgi:putative ABC transport system permease protein